MTVVPVKAAEAAGADSSFAVTVAQEFADVDDREDREDAEALPGTWGIDDRALQQLPTLGHVGRYALKHQLGSGGLGTVHAAFDPLLARAIAIKTLHVGADDSHRRMHEMQLLAEARTAAGLSHPNIVTIHDAGLTEQGVYIAMEKLHGRDLRELLADGWRPEPVQAVRLAKRLADALAYAHSRGVVHCDVKPANIYMLGRTQPKLLDFGIARVARNAQAAGPLPDIALEPGDDGQELGSPYYVAPEQLQGAVPDPRCDVYGVGVVLYELLAGRRAFAGHTLEGIRDAVLQGDVLPLQRVNGRVDAALSSIVERAMARDPAQRYRSARQLVRALRGWLDASASREAVPPLGGRSAPWAVFAGLGLLASIVFVWQALGDGARMSPDTHTVAQGARPSSVERAAAAASVASVSSVTLVATPPPAQVPNPSPPPPMAAQRVEPLPASPGPSVSAVRLPAQAPQPAAPLRAARVKAAPAPAATSGPPATGVVQLAISPWGQVEVNGAAAGTTPPLARLALPPGRHRIVVRNDDFAPFAVTVQVAEDKPVTLRHRFGS